jgi:hypothetical protein
MSSAPAENWETIERWLDAVTDNLRRPPRWLELKPVRFPPHPWRVTLFDDNGAHAFDGSDRAAALHEAARWCATELERTVS